MRVGCDREEGEGRHLQSSDTVEGRLDAVGRTDRFDEAFRYAIHHQQLQVYGIAGGTMEYNRIIVTIGGLIR